MKTEKLNKKYTAKELAGSFVFRNTLTAQQTEDAGKQLKEARKKLQKGHTPQDLLYAGVLQLRYQIEEYTASTQYNAHLSFAYFLRAYIKLSYKNNKEFAKDIHLDETELSQILNGHRDPSEKTLIRIELHSGNMLPALYWFKLLEKEKEYELETDHTLREREEKYVKNRLTFKPPKKNPEGTLLFIYFNLSLAPFIFLNFRYGPSLRLELKHMTFVDSSLNYLPVKLKRAISHVDCDTIKWFKTDGNYTTIYLNDSSSLVSRVSLKDLEDMLPSRQFVRIHKSFIVNRNYITKRRATKVTLGDTALTIGRAHQKQVYAFFDRLQSESKDAGS